MPLRQRSACVNGMNTHHFEPATADGSGTGLNRVDAVLFDRDGVLTFFDTEAATTFFRPLLPLSLFELAGRWQVYGETVGFPRNLAEERTFFAGFWTLISKEFSLSPDQAAVLAQLDYTRFIVPYPEVCDVLGRLHAAGIRLGVLSNFSLASIEQSLISTGLAHFFTVICASTVIGVAKPLPRAYEIAVQGLQVDPRRCLYFDDEPECVAGARQLGLRAYLVDRQAHVDDFAGAVLGSLRPVLKLALPSVLRY